MTIRLQLRRLTPWHMQLLAVVALALVVRGLYIVALADHNIAPLANGDVSFFRGSAALLAAGHGYISPYRLAKLGLRLPTAEHPPLWPLLLAAGDKLGFTSVEAQRFITATVGSGAVGAVGLIGRRLVSPRVGLLAAGVAALYPVLIAADGSSMSEPLDGLLLGAAVLSAYRLYDHPSFPVALLCGVLIGLASLVRAEGLALLALLVLPAAWPHRGRRWRLVSMAVVGAAVVLTPWTIRNFERFDTLVPTSNNDGTLIWGANCHETYYGVNAGFWVDTCPLAPYRLNEARLTDGLRAKGLRYAGSHLTRLPAVLLVRLLRTFSFYQPWRMSQFAEGENVTAANVGVVSFYLLVPLVCLGFVLLWRDRTPLVFGLMALVGLTLIVTMIGYGYPRFRHPAELAFVTAAAVTMDRVIGRFVGPSRPPQSRA